MEQNRDPRNKPTYIWSINPQQKEPRIYSEERSLFSKSCCENWTATCKRMKLDYYLTPHTKMNSKWIIDLNVRLEAIQLLEENIGSKLFDISVGENFLNLTPKSKATKAKIKKWVN